MKRNLHTLVLVSIALVAGCADAGDTRDTGDTEDTGDPGDGPESVALSETWIGEVKVSLSVPTASVREDEPVLLDVSLSNASAQDVRLSRSTALADGIHTPLLDVRRDGSPVRYLGIIARVIASSPDGHIVLKPGESVTHTVDLATAYDISVTGDYSIAYPGEPNAATVRLHAEGRRFLSPAPGDAEDRQVESSSEIGSTTQAILTGCNTAQTDAVRKSWGSARGLVDDALAYLAQPWANAPRYNTWFGTANEYRWGVVTGRFQNIASRFDYRDVDCRNDSTCVANPSWIAYVRTNQPYTVHVCTPFWSLPQNGADSKADTFVHELSHFYGTGDAEYGQSDCQTLAANDPIAARGNADNYAYFSANPGNLGY